MEKKHILYLILAILLCNGVGILAGQFTTTDTTWFVNLEKPALYPPGYFFGIVWTILYTFMGVALYLVIRKTCDVLPYVLFGVQLLLNFLWTFIFFTSQNVALALGEIIILFAVLSVTMLNFKKYSKTAFYLLLPYLLWVGFATYLTARIFVLNA